MTCIYDVTVAWKDKVELTLAEMVQGKSCTNRFLLTTIKKNTLKNNKILVKNNNNSNNNYFFLLYTYNKIFSNSNIYTTITKLLLVMLYV